MANFKERIRLLAKTPMAAALRKYVARARLRMKLKAYGNLPLSQVFTGIYERGLWGNSPEGAEGYFSGLGSYEKQVVDSYVVAVQQFLNSLETKPNVVDLGCGDFSVGSRIRPCCKGYIACDIVEPLINFNKEKFRSQDVDFRVLDLTKDPLPDCDVLFLRQVLQHLSNKHIKKMLPRLTTCCKYLVLTEHLPLKEPFTANIDITPGPGVRPGVNSGVVLSKPPFNVKAAEERTLCEIVVADGRIRTALFRFGSHS